MSDNNWHVGQEVVVGHHLDQRVDIIERLTLHQAVTKRGARFRLRDGRSVGTEGFGWFADPDPERVALVREVQERMALRRRIIAAVDMGVPSETLRRIAELIDAEKARRPA